MNTSPYIWQSKVRDYELDSQGIVNNATYVNYFEQCRNDYANSLGIDYHQYHREGYDLVVAKIEIQYRAPLKARDEFFVTAVFSEINEKRIQIEQEIRSKPGECLIAKATVYIACIELKTGQSGIPNRLQKQILSSGSAS